MPASLKLHFILHHNMLHFYCLLHSSNKTDLIFESMTLTMYRIHIDPLAILKLIKVKSQKY